ncbi:hypothetical protein BOTBODRAFT_180512 [Botryobasidium botryosum FD-172 SS1]|uniref:BTB domain-containing protein n=1 Tax=Botryobasidium botryosum (strain FD-172 SS1) TaxID=930990 RepID=A0A067LW90_BOTB1|nr:hypothetical protein BOTBODRAFT_180512 [Botryobasidium botryosum FD-172 SS1]
MSRHASPKDTISETCPLGAPIIRRLYDLEDYHQNGLLQEDRVVLALGHKPDRFCIPRHILIEHSPVFRATLELTGSKGDNSGGVSVSGVIKLPEDDPEYLMGVFGAYDSALISHPNNPSFEYIEGVLRLAHKYEFALAIQWAIGILRVDWSTNSRAWHKALIDPSQDDIRHAIALINLSRDTNINEFLACAFYLLCADTKWSDDPLVYKLLRAPDVSFLRHGIQQLYRRYAQNAQDSKTTVLPMDSDVPYHADSSPVQPSSAPGTSSQWEDFILCAATICAVTAHLPPIVVEMRKRKVAWVRSFMSETNINPTEVYMGGITLVDLLPAQEDPELARMFSVMGRNRRRVRHRAQV